MKTLIYQVAVGNIPTFYNVCINSVKQYCKKMGIDHVVQTTPILKITPTGNNRKTELDYLPIFEKENAFTYLDRYDKICVVDSDIYIRDTAPNIFNEMSSDFIFAAVRECDMPLTSAYRTKIQKFSRAQYQDLTDVMTDWHPQSGVPFYNMGLMMFSNKLLDYLHGQTPREFIQQPDFKKFVDGKGHYKWSTDQTLLNYWIRKEQIPTQQLSWKWNALFKAIQDQHLVDSYFVHFFLANNLPQRGNEIPAIINDFTQARKIKGHG